MAEIGQWWRLTPEEASRIQKWPPVAPIPAPRLADMLGVSPAFLRNWRHRKQGPSPEPSRRTRQGPKAVNYRVSEVLAWLDGVSAPAPWERDRAWLERHLKDWRFCDEEGFVDVKPDMTCQQTERAAQAVRRHASDRLFAEAAGIEEWPTLRR